MLKLAHLPILVILRGRGGPKPMQLVLSLSLVKEALALPGESSDTISRRLPTIRPSGSSS